MAWIRNKGISANVPFGAGVQPPSRPWNGSVSNYFPTAPPVTLIDAINDADKTETISIVCACVMERSDPVFVPGGAAPWISPFAIVEYGAFGCQFKFEVDITNGLTFTIPASQVRVSACVPPITPATFNIVPRIGAYMIEGTIGKTTPVRRSQMISGGIAPILVAGAGLDLGLPPPLADSVIVQRHPNGLIDTAILNPAFSIQVIDALTFAHTLQKYVDNENMDIPMPIAQSSNLLAFSGGSVLLRIRNDSAVTSIASITTIYNLAL